MRVLVSALWKHPGICCSSTLCLSLVFGRCRQYIVLGQSPINNYAKVSSVIQHLWWFGGLVPVACRLVATGQYGL